MSNLNSKTYASHKPVSAPTASQPSQPQPSQSSQEERSHIPYTNELHINGKLGGDPEKLTINDRPVYKFSLAHWQPKGKPTVWFRVYCYDSLLFPLMETLTKGSEVLIVGKFTYEVYNTTPQLGILLNSVTVNR